MSTQGTLRLQSVKGTGLHFKAQFPKFAITYDSGPEAAEAGPMMNLLGSIAACGAMDVISILRKKRLEITGYEVEMEADRATEHPKRYTAIRLTHRVKGRDVPLAALEEAVRLSAERYCSVRHTLDPAMPITDRCEVAEG